MTTRDSLHRLVDQLSESSLEFAEVSLRGLLASEGDPVWAELEDAPTDEEPLPAATIKKLDAARRRVLGGDHGRIVVARDR